MQQNRELRKKENNPTINWDEPKEQKELKDFPDEITDNIQKNKQLNT